MLPETYTLAEVADSLRCSGRKIATVAKLQGIGMQLGGRAGWRFTATDVTALQDAMRPAPMQLVGNPGRRRRRHQ